MSTIPMEAGRDGEAVELPSEPYPGLRPFLKHEAMLLLGRERQIHEVIERLRQTQFVAVIGGSGSGKSSLVLAGVVPELRSFGIPGAGDFWLQMVCTPGTNVTPTDADASQDTPITRLAWKFAKLLKPAEPPKTESARLADIAAVFRQEAGFARLIDTYADQLLKDAGPQSDDGRLLFVIDQFEELFHLTNRRVEDARLMVERVIDHFFNPHPRCFVVLTMRSEHLNDCAGYLELPDAINKSSYLVRRLDEEELREAIVGPVQRYLRLQHRLDLPGTPSLPQAVEFDPLVVDRLLGDVRAIVHDPDHLPLLQHLLARLWKAACGREGVATGVPAKITWDDLCCAVAAVLPGDAGSALAPLNDKINTLRTSLENWPEAVYLKHTEPQQVMLESVFRRLALKDPNTGMYIQQRIDVDDATLFSGVENPRATLRALLKDGYLGSVDYLFWDTENPRRETLKVSHESFIRGWSRFRNWADEDDRQFQVYLRLLDDCARWDAAKRSDEANCDGALSGGETLRVYQDASLEAALRDPERRGRLERLLKRDRDGQRVLPMAVKALEFLTQSMRKRDRRLAEREEELRHQQAVKDNAARAERVALVEVQAEREKNRRIKLWRRFLALGLLGLVVFSVSEWMLARREYTLHRGYALAAETQVKLQPQFLDFDAAKVPLRHALQGAHFFQIGSAQYTGPAALPPLRWFYSPRIDGLQSTELLGEVRSIASLRSVLRGAVWPVPLPVEATSWLRPAQPSSCDSVWFASKDESGGFAGAKFYAGPSMADQRGLIVSARGVQGVALYVGRKNPANKHRCDIEKQLISAPAEALRVGIAADLSNLVFEFEGYFQLYAIIWGDSLGVGTRPRVVINKLDAESLGPGDELVQTLPSAYGAFATDIQIANRMLRVFDMESTPITESDAMKGKELNKATENIVCAAFAKAQTLNDKQDDVWSVKASGDPRTYCLHVKPSQASSNQSGSVFLASLYAFEDEAQAGDSTKHLPLFLQEVVGTVRPVKFNISVEAGWLAVKGENGEWRALPWGLRAWRGLANDVFAAPSEAPSTWIGRAWRTLRGLANSRFATRTDSSATQDDQPFKLLLSGASTDDVELSTRFPAATGLPRKVGSAMGVEAAAAAQSAPSSAPARSPAHTPPTSSTPSR